MSSDKTATERLRELLDECGVKWVEFIDHTATAWTDGTHGFVADENDHGKLYLNMSMMSPEQAIAATLGPKVTGDTSDGYHTFNELYHHRAVLFSVIVRDYRELAWKSMRHHDGTMYDGMFIVGIETPKGQATYHYDIDPYWDMFDCKELDRAPEWDGHSPADAIERIATLGRGTCHEVWLLMATDIGNGCEEVLGVYSSEGAAEAAASEDRYGYAFPNVQRWEVDA